jgi:glycosyltransferase involved in cell wall biosynthesis
MAFFSVIISVYNKETYISSTIKSVLKQTFTDFSLIIVNDGSTDKSLDIITTITDDRITVINTKNQGASKCRNTGLKAASNNFIALLDGDDLWDDNYLKIMHKCILEYPEKSVFTAALAQKYGSKIVPVKYNFTQKSIFEVRNFFKSSSGYSLLSSSSIVFKKTILEKTGYFDSSIASGQDTDLWIRIGLYYDVLFINKVLAYYRYAPNSLSNITFDPNKKPRFNKYLKEEKRNHPLKAFLDRNRYSMALLSKVQGDKKNYSFYTSHLNTANLSFRQNILLKSPQRLLKLFLKLKSLKGEKIYYPNN